MKNDVTAVILIMAALSGACSGKKAEPHKGDMAMHRDTLEMNTMKGHDVGGMDMEHRDSTMDMNNMPGMNMQDSANTADDMAGMDMQSSSSELILTDKQVQLGGITVDTFKSSLFSDKMVVTATLVTNESKINSVSSRILGRIEKLYFKNFGDYVAKGSKLFDLYSEDLNNAKQEYLLALQRKNLSGNSVIDFAQLIQAARIKLLLWGLSEAQLSELELAGKASHITTFYSNASGYITALEVKEGDYVMEGGTIVRLADFSTLWAEAQVYSTELSKIDKTALARVEIPDVPGLKLIGKIAFFNPELSPETRINLVRVTIPNIGNKLRPGMPAYVFFDNWQRTTTTLPIDAVVRGKDGALVWVQTGKNKFESRMVTTGTESGNQIEIKSGVKPGDLVVIEGVFWLNSEFLFKKGGTGMEGMKM